MQRICLALLLTLAVARGCDNVHQFTVVTNGNSSCVQATVCKPGETETTPLTLTSDRVCTQCQAGTIDADANPSTPCTPCKKCKDGIDTECTPVTNTICKSTKNSHADAAKIGGGIAAGILALLAVIVLIRIALKDRAYVEVQPSDERNSEDGFETRF